MIGLNEYFKDWAKHIIHGNDCKSSAEDTIQNALYGENWYEIPNCPCLFDIGSDSYDGSLEFYFAYITTDEQIEDFVQNHLTQEICEFIINNGCGGFWMNFYPTEEHNSNDKTYEIYYSKFSKNIATLKTFKDGKQLERSKAILLK